MEPLVVRCRLRTPITFYTAPTLDGLLSWSIVHDAYGTGLPDLPDHLPGYELPAPMGLLGRYGPYQLPLWAASEFEPCGDTVEDTVYHHKRHEMGDWTQNRGGMLNLSPVKGRFMDRRIPRPIRYAEAWQATCVGNAAEILRLLQSVTHVGKRRAVGCGEVSEWSVAPSPESWEPCREGKLIRNIPALAAALLPAPPTEPVVLIPCTPPYWNQALLLPGWRAGTALPS
jgi:CRISPR type IV-associated protein Csf3